MTAVMSTSLYCDRETAPRVDGMRTICGLEFGPQNLTREQLRHIAREFGWGHSGANSDFCPRHHHARKDQTA